MKICFNQGIACDSKCRCKNCENQPGQVDGVDDVVPSNLEMHHRQRVPPTKGKAESACSARVSFDESTCCEPPKLPGGYTYGYGLPSPLADAAGETALV